MLLEFRNEEPRALACFTISWSFLQILLEKQPQFKNIFRVRVDGNLLKNREECSSMALLMKDMFEEKYVAHN